MSGSIVVGVAATRRGPDRLGRVGRRPRRRASTRPSSRSRRARQPGRDLVDRRRGDDQDAEDREQHQQRHHDVRRAQQVEQQARDDEADGAAGLLEVARRRRAAGCGLPLAMCTMPSTPKRERGPADDLAARRGRCARGSRMVRQPDVDQHQRARASRPCRPSRRPRCGRRPSTDAGQLPPHGAGRRRRRGRSGTGRRRRDGARARGRARRRRPCGPPRRRAWATRQPHRGQRPAERAGRAEDRSRPRAHGTGRGAAGRGRGRARTSPESVGCCGWYSGIGCSSRPEARLLRDVLLLRDPGGEDVRVAMLRP